MPSSSSRPAVRPFVWTTCWSCGAFSTGARNSERESGVRKENNAVCVRQILPHQAASRLHRCRLVELYFNYVVQHAGVEASPGRRLGLTELDDEA